jgi:hypothetical protein
MSAVIIRNETLVPQMATTNRGVAVLSDGSVVALVISNAFSGDWRLMHSVDRVTWTTAFSGATLDPKNASMIVDSSDNIHIAYQKISTNSMYYRNFPKGTGYVWTAGTEVEVSNPGGTNYYGRKDLEIFPGGAVVVVAHYKDDPGNTSHCRVFTKPQGSSTFTLRYSTATISEGGTVRGLSVARSLAGAVSNVVNFMLFHNQGLGSGGGFRAMKMNVTTGVLTANDSIYTVTHEEGYGGIYGNLFSVANDEWLFAGAQGHAAGSTGQKALAIKLNMTTMLGKATRVKADYTGSPDENTFSTSAYMATGKLVLFSPHRTGQMATNGVTATICSISGNTLTWGTPFVLEEGVGFEFMRAGANRNFSSIYADLITSRTIDFKHHAVKLDRPGTPTGIGPTGTQVSGTPTLSATLPAAQGRVRGRWQLATNPGFTGVVKTVTDDDFVTSGFVSASVPENLKLAKGTWYVRAVSLSEFDTESIASATVNFLVAHPPGSTGHFPFGGLAVPSSLGGGFDFSWEFTDPYIDDVQTAYRIEVINSSNSVIYDSGKVTSTNEFHHISNQLNGALAQDLRWHMWTWDSEDTVSVAASPNAVFQVYNPPVVAIVSPTGSVTNPTPLIDWTVTTGDARVQATYRITIEDTDTGLLVLDTPVFSGATTAYTPTMPVLENLKEYEITVYVTDSLGLSGTDTQIITTSWIVPLLPPFTVDATLSNSEGYVTIGWDDSNRDEDWVQYRVYRRLPDSTSHELIYESSAETSSYEFADWFLRSNTFHEWTVVQVADRFGTLIESPRIWTADYMRSDSYWLLHPTDSDLHIRLNNVTSDSFTDDQEEESFVVLGRGRHKDVGTYLGYAGTLTASIYDRLGKTAREQRLEFELLRRENVPLMMRNPFGDLFKVVTGTVSIDRLAGVGTQEYHTITVPYEAVY